MSYLYVNDDGAVIGINGGRVTVTYKDGMKQSIPIETLESVTILGKSQMTTQCTIEFLTRGIPVSYFSRGGYYFGKLQSTQHINVERQRKQDSLANTAFSLEFSRKILNAKLRNQLVVLRRYAKSRAIDCSEEEKYISISIGKLPSCILISELMGFEGVAARYYFQGLGKCVESDFAFKGRSRRPPLDPFNSMLSFGYSIIMNEMQGIVEQRGLNAYFGFMHSDREHHATLVSDLIEEWRAVIVDSMTMSLINGHEIGTDSFYHELEDPGCYFTKSGLRIYLNKLEKKMNTQVRYLPYVDYPVSFRKAINLQVAQLVKAIENEDISLYNPILIR